MDAGIPVNSLFFFLRDICLLNNKIKASSDISRWDIFLLFDPYILDEATEVVSAESDEKYLIILKSYT